MIDPKSRNSIDMRLAIETFLERVDRIERVLAHVVMDGQTEASWTEDISEEDREYLLQVDRRTWMQQVHREVEEDE